jgi:RNase H-fold protein (predicted Holliday junction resolvase)
MTHQFSTVIAIDPGKDKCGLAIVTSARFDAHRVLDAVVEHGIVPRNEVMSTMRTLLKKFPNSQIVIGHATTSGVLREELQREWPEDDIAIIDETGSTLEARGLYWRANPPRGWRRLLPLSSQVPPQSIDDFAAIVLAARFLTSSTR